MNTVSITTEVRTHLCRTCDGSVEVTAGLVDGSGFNAQLTIPLDGDVLAAVALWGKSLERLLATAVADASKALDDTP